MTKKEGLARKFKVIFKNPMIFAPINAKKISFDLSNKTEISKKNKSLKASKKQIKLSETSTLKETQIELKKNKFSKKKNF